VRPNDSTISSWVVPPASDLPWIDIEQMMSTLKNIMMNALAGEKAGIGSESAEAASSCVVSIAEVGSTSMVGV